MSIIKLLQASEILDSRGNPTISVFCELESGATGDAAVPSGKSTGSHEALELRDHDMSRYEGLGVLNAVNNINTEINNFTINKDFNQKTLDKALIDLDGTENKSRLGANAILGVSMAFAKACAKEKDLELYEYFGDLINSKNFTIPIPCLNIINGGKHANNGVDIQEFMIVLMGTQSFYGKIEMAGEIISALREILEEHNYSTNFGDEGGFAPHLSTNEEAIELIEKAIDRSGHLGDEVKIALDVAASSFYESGFYNIKINGEEKSLTNIELINWYEKLVNNYSIVSIEDPLAEEDWDGFKEITKRLGDRIKIIGDDITVTNTKLIKRVIEEHAVNGVLIKPNQIGTVSETIEAIQMTKNAGWSAFISHRSGETLDTTIADLAVGLSCEFIKAGSITKAERMCKYERLIEVENKLNMI